MKEPRANKKFGQHFLNNPNSLQRMVDQIAPQENDCFIEIGPGTGALTLPISGELGDRGILIALEVDARMIKPLGKKIGNKENVHIIHTDALHTDLGKIIHEHGITQARIIGNLPYNISVHLIEKFLHLANLGVDPAAIDVSGESLSSSSRYRIKDMHFLVQKEIAQRLFAPVGNNNYGRLALMMELLGSGEKIFNLPPSDFSPPPKVTSSFIRLIPELNHFFLARLGEENSQEIIAVYTKLQRVNQIITAAFSRPNRKMSNTLKKLVADTLESTKLGDKRARQTSLREFLSLLE